MGEVQRPRAPGCRSGPRTLLVRISRGSPSAQQRGCQRSRRCAAVIRSSERATVSCLDAGRRTQHCRSTWSPSPETSGGKGADSSPSAQTEPASAVQGQAGTRNCRDDRLSHRWGS